MNSENRNLILAIALSMAVLFGWQIFIVGPELERETVRQQAIAEQMAAADAESRDTLAQSAQGTATMPAAGSDDATPISDAPRITIDAPLVTGSISLAGLRFDDVVLKDYQETQEEGSPNIQLLQRTDATMPYFVEFRWTLDGSNLALPDASTVWTADRQILAPGKPVTFTWDNGQGLLFSRVIAIDENYLFSIEDAVRNNSGGALAFNHYGRVRRHGTPVTSGIWILHEGPIGVFDDIVSYQDYDDLAETRTDKRAAEDLTFDATPGGWIGFSDKYWLTALIPDQQATLNFKFSEVGSQDAVYQAGFINAQARLVGDGTTLAFASKLFVGAKKVTLLDSYGETLGLQKFDRAIDFGWFYFLTKPFFYAINWLNSLLGNFGLAVIAFTIVVKIFFFPLANKSYRSMGKMRLLSPKIQQIRERYADDRMGMNREMMDLYKKEKINPAAGCLPVLLQIPVFFALYKVLFVTIEMRHAPFFGWITDLSAPDPTSVFNVFGLLPFGVEFLPPFLQLGAWPIMMGLSMFFQMRLNPPPPDPVQARIFQFMPLIFTFLLATFPAGLVIYWTWNNLLSMAQQWYIIRSIAKES